MAAFFFYFRIKFKYIDSLSVFALKSFNEKKVVLVTYYVWGSIEHIFLRKWSICNKCKSLLCMILGVGVDMSDLKIERIDDKFRVLFLLEMI